MFSVSTELASFFQVDYNQKWMDILKLGKCIDIYMSVYQVI